MADKSFLAWPFFEQKHRDLRSGAEDFAKTVVPHIILALFSAIILLPLLWILRVSLTDKLTAYKIPPEIGTLGLMNYVTIFADYPFVTWFLNSLVVALATTLISGLLITSSTRSVRTPLGRSQSRAFFRLRTTAFSSHSVRPAWRAVRSPWSRSNFATPWPTVPNPMIATLVFSITLL